MVTSHIIGIAGVMRHYEWGTQGGISRVMGAPLTTTREAELWFGAHPSAPSRLLTPLAGAADLAGWSVATGSNVPFLLKVLSAEAPLSLQAHPTAAQAAEAFALEDSRGIALDAPERNYKDRFAKPELIVALEDGFEALCGFRPINETRSVVRDLQRFHPHSTAIETWLRHLTAEQPLSTTLKWLLGDADEVSTLMDEIQSVVESGDHRWGLLARLAAIHPGDPGIAIALMLNHVVLSKGEALWLAAGNIHAYLRGTGVELMGPSDNVLRGGLTVKHVDSVELQRVVDFTPGPAPRLPSVTLSESALSYRPRSLPSGKGVAFELLAITGNHDFATQGPAIAVVVDGDFRLSSAGVTVEAARGSAHLVTDGSPVHVRGRGLLFVALADRAG
ncbi:UNVERIFIED_CONTAM: mannose-6-phosphate isomerase, class I [Microbacterium sp. SLM126]